MCIVPALRVYFFLPFPTAAVVVLEAFDSTLTLLARLVVALVARLSAVLLKPPFLACSKALFYGRR